MPQRINIILYNASLTKIICCVFLWIEVSVNTAGYGVVKFNAAYEYRLSLEPMANTVGCTET